jgi:hypothetical protein
MSELAEDKNSKQLEHLSAVFLAKVRHFLMDVSKDASKKMSDSF